MNLTDTEKERFIEWVKLHIDESIIPEDSSHEGAIVYNLIHAIRGDKERYNAEPHQEEDIAQWLLSKNQYF